MQFSVELEEDVKTGRVVSMRINSLCFEGEKFLTMMHRILSGEIEGIVALQSEERRMVWGRDD